MQKQTVVIICFLQMYLSKPIRFELFQIMGSSCSNVTQLNPKTEHLDHVTISKFKKHIDCAVKRNTQHIHLSKANAF